MQVIICQECGKKYNNSIKACPECGCPTSYSNKELINYMKVAENIYIEAEGNKIKAIKLLKEYLKINNDEALYIINEVCEKYEKNISTNNITEELASQVSNMNSEIRKLSTDINNNRYEEPKAQAVSSTSKKSIASTAIRGTLGAALLGPVGLVIGAATGKNKTKTTFVTKGLLGNKKVVTAKNNSRKFKRLAKKCK